MATVKKTSSAQLMPVFYDKTGRRLTSIVISTVILCSCLIIAAAIITPFALVPLWSPPSNSSSDFPRKFLAQADMDDIPIIGDDQFGIFNRMVKVEHTSDGHVALVDPFSQQVYRIATEEERAKIGTSPYALDNFGRPADNTLMLTFDDGPDAKYTPELLDLLAREHVPVTFFVVGKAVVKNPAILRRIVREGHMAANHTMTHHADFKGGRDFWNREQLIATDRVMRATAQYSSRLFRIPKGDPDKNPLAVLQAQQLGYLQVDMDIDTRDWELPPGVPIAVPELDGQGHVVLLHDSGGDRTATIDMVEKFIATAKQQGYTFSTLAPMLPAEYIPTKNAPMTAGDIPTLHTLQLVWVLPGKILTALFWFGVVSLSTISLFYLVLTVLFHYQSRQRRWPALPDEALPFVSVVFAAYNEEKVVAKTIASLKDSDYPASRFEVIVVNDGSSDRTLEILRECARAWPTHLIVINKQNGGKSAAINTGVEEARGEVVVTLDADTIFHTDTIRLLSRHFAGNTHGKQIGAVAGHVKVGNRGNILTWWQSLEYMSGICVTRVAEGALDAISIVPGACSAWRRSALMEIGGFSESTLAEDADATLMLHRLGYRVVQEYKAIAETEAPESIVALAKQRKRWVYGNIQALWKHRAVLLRPRYGMLGMVTLPYALLSLLVPLAFLPITIVVTILLLADGNWQSVALFAAFIACVHAIISVMAIVISRESMKHLLVVPIYRLIYEPLRAYLLYASVYRIIKGTVVKWDKLERLNSVSSPAPSVTRAV